MVGQEKKTCSIAKLQISPDLPVQQKKLGWLYIWMVVGCLVGCLYAEIRDIQVSRTFPGFSYDFLRTFSGLSQDFFRTFSGLHKTFPGLSQDFLRTFS